MFLEFLYAKIHNAIVTEANLYYIGSITIDSAILNKLQLFENQKVQVVNINTGARINTYIISGASNSGTICINGAAARLFQARDKVIIMAYCSLAIEELENYKPKVAFMNDKNQILEIKTYEKEQTYVN